MREGDVSSSQMDTSSVRAANRWDDGRVRSRKRPSREADTTIHELRGWGAGGCRRPLRQGVSLGC